VLHAIGVNGKDAVHWSAAACSVPGSAMYGRSWHGGPGAGVGSAASVYDAAASSPWSMSFPGSAAPTVSAGSAAHCAAERPGTHRRTRCSSVVHLIRLFSYVVVTTEHFEVFPQFVCLLLYFPFCTSLSMTDEYS